MRKTIRNTRLNDWQEAGIMLGGVLVDSTRLVNQSLSEITRSEYRMEIEQYCSGKESRPFPSEAALQALKAAIIKVMMEKPE